MGLLRYPGSKAKLLNAILKSFPPEAIAEMWTVGLVCYCEPFFGSGAMGWKVLRLLRSPDTLIVINDLDPGIADLWRSVLQAPEELIARILAFTPSPAAFYEYKEADGAPDVEPVTRGFRKLVLHQTSFSGLGAMAGGPLGGRHGRGDYNVACRWKPQSLAAKVRRWNKVFRWFARVDVRNDDFALVLDSLPPGAFVYLDPPYYAQGPALYKYAMTHGDHVRLARLLRRAQFEWALSYDEHPEIRSLYDWARIRFFEMTATIETARSPQRRKNSEIVITRP